MEESLIFDLLSDKLFKYREELKKAENNFTEWAKKSREALEKSLNKEQLELVGKYKHDSYLNEEYIQFQYDIKLLNLGIKIGMQLQKAFDEYENE